MFLKKIHLENFKCLDNIEIDFSGDGKKNRQWTVILGENGTGKSNLLKAIALITGGSNALGELIGNSEDWIKNGKESCKINATLTTKKGEERELTLSFEKSDTLGDIIEKNRAALSLIDDALEHTDRNYFVIAYGASRRLPNEKFGGFKHSRNGNRTSNVLSLFDNSYALNPLASWIIDLDYQKGTEGIELVKETLSDFLPDTTFHSINRGKKQVLFETEDGLIALENLSDGYQNMAAWIGDLLYKITETFSDYSKPLETRGLLLVDELDLHLHPKWQRNLIDFITRKLPNFQIVATTHSPLTAQQTDSDELYALKRNENRDVELVPFLGSPKGLLINQLLMSPVFGLATDESRELELEKKEYDELKNNGELSLDKKRQLNSLKRSIKIKSSKRAMPSSLESSLKVLKSIESKLNINQD